MAVFYEALPVPEYNTCDGDDGSDAALLRATAWLTRRLAARGFRDRGTDRLAALYADVVGREHMHVVGRPRGSWLLAPFEYRGLDGQPHDW